MPDRTADLILEYLKSQSQFAYFQLGLAASAIAYAVHETKGQSLSETPWPFGAAVILWAISFATGAYGIEARLDGIKTNAQFLQARSGLKGIDAVDAEAKLLVKQGLEIVNSAAVKPLLRFQFQRWTLLFGAIAYVAGHLMQMRALG